MKKISIITILLTLLIGCVGEESKKNDIPILFSLVVERSSDEISLQKLAETEFLNSVQFNSENKGQRAKDIGNENSLKKVVNTAIKDKTNIEFLKNYFSKHEKVDSQTKERVEEALSLVYEPTIFTKQVLSYPEPTIMDENISRNKSRGFLWQKPGPNGWYCYSPIFGKMGPHPDYWFSAIVCAWAQGYLVLSVDNGCYIFNQDPSAVCW